MKRAHPKPRLRLLAKGQDDHVDAWLMSYADMITLLFMFFVIFVSVAVSQQGKLSQASGEPEHPYIEERHGNLMLKTYYDGIYRALVGIVSESNAEQNIAVEENTGGLSLDVSTLLLFDGGSAYLRDGARPMLARFAAVLKQAPQGSAIEVEAYTDDTTPESTAFANNWELSAMRAARIIGLLVEEGVDPAMLYARNYADSRPLVPNADARGNPIPENRARNQRIVIRVASAPEEPRSPALR